MPSPSVLVLVLTYNAGPPLEACLTSLLRTTYPNARIVVLDNGSTDGSDRIPDRLGIPVHRFGENLLYCGAYNRAIRDMRAGADFVLLSNPDIVVPPGTLGRMVGLAEADPRIGSVGPVQRRVGPADPAQSPIVSGGDLRKNARAAPSHLRSRGTSGLSAGCRWDQEVLLGVPTKKNSVESNPGSNEAIR